MPAAIPAGAYWRDGTRTKVDPGAAYAEFERIRETNDGRLTPEEIVKRAKSRRNPLHGHFTWDDSEAAHKYRLNEAQYLIRHLVYTPAETNHQVRQYSLVQAPKSAPAPRRYYTDTEQAMSDPEFRKQILDNAMADLKRFRAKYGALAELAGVVGEIDSMLAAHA